jgi:hypothetical protein
MHLEINRIYTHETMRAKYLLVGQVRYGFGSLNKLIYNW